MEIQQLRHILAAAQSSNYSEAAKKCFTSRQNIAHSIKMIENELGVTLFNRRGTNMILTLEGKRVAIQANDIVERVDRLRMMFYDSELPESPLNLAVGTNLLAGLPSGASELIADFPGGVHLHELSCKECYTETCSGEVDAAMVMCMNQYFPRCSSFKVLNPPLHCVGLKLNQYSSDLL